MQGRNKVELRGNLTQKPELKNLPSGMKVCEVGLATTEKYKDREDTQFHNLVFWGNLAELVEKYLTKGSPIFIDGKIEYQRWEDHEGKKKYKTVINVKDMNFLPGKRKEENKPEGRPENYGKVPF